jgi:hypothetical protein
VLKVATTAFKLCSYLVFVQIYLLQPSERLKTAHLTNKMGVGTTSKQQIFELIKDSDSMDPYVSEVFILLGLWLV